MRLLKEQERICRELGNKDVLAVSLINQASLLAGEMGRSREALPLAEEAYRLATQNGLVALAQQIEPILDRVRSENTRTASATVYVSTPHPGANADNAAQLNIQYQQELAGWNALSWWKRLKVKKPEPPRGI